MEAEEIQSTKAKLPIAQPPLPDHLHTEDEAQLAEEAKLVQQAAEGDMHAFGVIYEVCLSPVYRHIYRKLEDIFEAESLTSETFTRALNLLTHGHYDWMGKPFRAWLIGIADNILKERYRVLKNTPVMEDLNDILEYSEPVSKEDDILDSIVQQEERAAAWQLVEELPEVERSVIILRHVYELSYAQIAERLSRSEHACKQIHYRAIKKLKLKVQQAGMWENISKDKQNSS